MECIQFAETEVFLVEFANDLKHVQSPTAHTGVQVPQWLDALELSSNCSWREGDSVLHDFDLAVRRHFRYQNIAAYPTTAPCTRSKRRTGFNCAFGEKELGDYNEITNAPRV